jgi:phage terminase large subunit
MIANLELPVKLQPLFTPKRYKIVYGGRGSGKSWGAATALLILGAQKPLRVLCAREIQISIADSVHKLLKDQIYAHGLEDFYTVQNNSIFGKNGTEFIFVGLQRNIDSVKSMEGITHVWCEEAVNISHKSWEVLIPTIRKNGSEIWITFNPDLDTDETYERFVTNPPDESIVIEMNYKDNPWFPEVLEMERLNLKKKDFKAYLNIWEGQCRSVVDGAVYGAEIEAAIEHERITDVPYNPMYPVHTFQDLGWNDFNATWYIQKVGEYYHVIDYDESQFSTTEMDVKRMQEKNYVYGTDFIPHDGNKTDKTSGMSSRDIMKKLGRNVKVTSRLDPRDGIRALRTLFPMMKFDRDKCKQGLNRIKKYKYKVDEFGQMSKEPKHDEASHAGDALRTFATSIKDVQREKKEKKQHMRPKRGYGRI